MPNPLTLLTAKLKAVSLFAGTALAISALVGGGAVALTAVSAERPLTAAPGAQSAAAPGAQSATPTATIGIQPSPLPGQVDSDGDRLDDVTGLPLGFACDASRNHGQNVSTYARSLPKGPGRGPLVSAVAKSDCGKTASSASPAAEPAKAAKPAKAQKPAKADKPEKAQKPAKAAKPEKAQKPAKAEPAKTDRPAKAQKPAKADSAEQKPAKSKD